MNLDDIIAVIQKIIIAIQEFVAGFKKTFAFETFEADEEDAAAE